MANTNQIKITIDTLEKVLSDQLLSYEQYANLLEADGILMSRLNINELEKSNKVKNTLLLKLQTMDQARQNLVRQLALEYGIQAETIRITDICEFVSTEEKSRLLKLRTDLHQMMDRLKGLQNKAAHLASTSLSWINGSMATLKRLLTPVGTYNPQGRVDHPSSFAGRVVEKQA